MKARNASGGAALALAALAFGVLVAAALAFAALAFGVLLFLLVAAALALTALAFADRSHRHVAAGQRGHAEGVVGLGDGNAGQGARQRDAGGQGNGFDGFLQHVLVPLSLGLSALGSTCPAFSAVLI